jgi:hypothetical protein
MGKIEQLRAGVQPGLKIIAPSIAYGVLTGTVATLLMPSAISFYAGLAAQFSRDGKQTLADKWWFDSLVAPPDAVAILLVAFACILFIWRSALLSFLRRCYSFTIYEGAVVWGVCTFILWSHFHWLVRLSLFVAALLLTYLIARIRTPLAAVVKSIVTLDRPISDFAHDKLDRKPLILSLAKQLISDGAPAIALVGAYGDGKTSILNLLEKELAKGNTVVVRFKSSLPGDDITLVSTLFNSISKQLRTRFFVRRLRSLLKRFARRISGLLPSASGLREMFAEQSQQEELHELTERLVTVPVHRIVVLLDDMDRMQGNELRTLLKVIRATEEYPKLSFVCAFNKKALVDAFIRHQVVDRVVLKFTSSQEGAALSGDLVGQVAADDTRGGYEFLEKFFPVQVPVPKLDDGQIGKEFDFRFNQFAERNGLSMLPEETAAFDKAFRPFWKPYFLPFLNNLRKINSYFNALSAAFALVKGEVNLIDFMCIELLRQMEPEVYEQVFKHRSLFYYPEMDITRWDEREIELDDHREKKKLDAAFERVFRNLHGPERESVLSLLGTLFPKVNDYRNARSLSSSGKPSELEGDKQKHIYHPDHFATYFSLHVQEGYVSTHEIETLVAVVNAMPNQADAETHFIEYLHALPGVKKYRFFEKMSRLADMLLPMPARALAIAIATESLSLAHDDFDMGEFGKATRLELVLANRFRETAEITQILSDIIAGSASDALAQKVYRFATDKEANKIFDSWEFVDFDEVKKALASRLKAKYFAGGNESIYKRSSTFRDWQLLFMWAHIGPESRQDVTDYLADEFDRRPASIGKHIQWLTPSLGNADGEKAVNELFPLSDLATFAKKQGSKAYSNTWEQQAVENLIAKYGGSGQSISA